MVFVVMPTRTWPDPTTLVQVYMTRELAKKACDQSDGRDTYIERELLATVICRYCGK